MIFTQWHKLKQGSEKSNISKTCRFFGYEGQATVNANNLKHANLIDFRNNVQRVELVAVLQCGSQRRDPGLSDDVR